MHRLKDGQDFPDRYRYRNQYRFRLFKYSLSDPDPDYDFDFDPKCCGSNASGSVKIK